MANTCNYPKFHAIDSNGDPLSGGKLYTYSAGTTTPKDSYSDKDGSTPHTNPVILDSNGEAEIYLSGNYKLVLVDADDVAQWTIDEFRGMESAATGLSDDDGDTKVQVEESVDEDIIRFDCAGTQVMQLEQTDIYLQVDTDITGDIVVSGDITVEGDVSGDAFLDENDMASDSAVKWASQQSIKAYVDTLTDPMISGDGTAGRVFRSLTLKVGGLDDNDTINITMSDDFNGHTLAEDTYSKDETTNGVTFAATGRSITIAASALGANNPVWSLGTLRISEQDVGSYTAGAVATANTIQVTVYTSLLGAAVDLATALDTGEDLYIQITYITDG